MKTILSLNILCLIVLLCLNCGDSGKKSAIAIKQPPVIEKQKPPTEKNDDATNVAEGLDNVDDRLKNMSTKNKKVEINKKLTDNNNPIQGVDISKWQGHELDKIVDTDDIGFIFCKATEGSNYVDPMFTHNWSKIKTDQSYRGAYHFYLTSHDPIKQAQHFVKTVVDLSPSDLPLVLDIEGGSIPKSQEIDIPTLQKDLLLFLKKVEALTGRTPLLYTNSIFANKYLLNSGFADYPLWLAQYVDRASPNVPKTWQEKGWMFWQKSGGTYKLHGVKTDFDVFNGSKEDLEDFVRGGQG